MEDLNINRDKPEMTDDQILKHKNFDSVMKAAAVTKVPWYKMGKLWITVGTFVGAFVITTLVITYLKESITATENEVVEENEIVKDVLVEEAIVESIISDENESSIIHVTNKRVINTPLGLAIEVPGEVITSEGGIDKDQYDIELTSFQLPENVEFPSYSKIECFNVALYSEGEKVELYGSDAMIVKEAVTIYELNEGTWMPSTVYDYESEEVAIDSVPSMLLPLKVSKQPFSFDASYDVKSKTKEYVEIAGYENFVFQPINEVPEEWMDPQMWEDVTIDKISDGVYELSLYKNEVVKKCNVKVVFRDAEFQIAMNKYNSTYVKSEVVSDTLTHFQVVKNGGSYIVIYP